MLQLSGEIFDLDKFLKKNPDSQDDPEPGKCSGFVKVIIIILIFDLIHNFLDN